MNEFEMLKCFAEEEPEPEITNKQYIHNRRYHTKTPREKQTWDFIIKNSYKFVDPQLGPKYLSLYGIIQLVWMYKIKQVVLHNRRFRSVLKKTKKHNRRN